MKISEEKKKAAIAAATQGAKIAAEASANKPNLKWYERLAWILLAGISYAAAALFTGCETAQAISNGAHAYWHAKYPGEPCLIDAVKAVQVEPGDK